MRLPRSPLPGLARRVTTAARPATDWLARRPDLVVYAAYVLMAVWVNARFWLRPYSRISFQQPVEHLQAYWYLEHAAQAVRHLQNPFFATQLNAPDGINLMANASALGLTIPMTPVTLLAGPQFAYVVLVTVALAASAAAAYYVLSRYLVSSRVAAAIAGAVWGFAPGAVHHANGQPFLVATFLIPFIALLLFRLGEPDHALRRGVVLGVLITWQAFISEELLLITLLAGGLALLILAIARRGEAKRRLRGFATAGPVALGVAAVLLAYPLWFQFGGPQSYDPAPGTPAAEGENLAAFVAYARESLAGTPNQRLAIGTGEENSWYSLPLVVLVLAIAVFLWRRSLSARVAAIVGVVFGLFALGPALKIGGRETPVPGPWRLIEGLPVVGLGQPARLTYAVTAAIAVLLALAIEAVPRMAVATGPVSFRTMWFVALAVVLVPLFPTALKATPTPTQPAFIADGRWREFVDSDHTVTPLPLSGHDGDQLSLLIQLAGYQAVNEPGGPFLRPDDTGHAVLGATGPTHELFDGIAAGNGVPTITDELRAGVIADLRRWHTAIIVVDPTQKYRNDLLKAITEITNAPLLGIGGLWVFDVRSLVDAGVR